ncbi:CheB methylesterase domain-containing protein [Niallia sp. Krafla_26]|uniref:CheB methylesterase domain-containing protein n=1 Tax=Niallia sp. Krafla_26 TaxID=3064703 RepID=UPI003D18749D
MGDTKNRTLVEKKTTDYDATYSKIELSKSYHIKDWSDVNKILLIGTSTGGPNALQTVLSRFPENIPIPIVVVQHMPPGFTKSLANRLNSLSKIKVKEAENQEVLQNGTAYIAPGGYQLTLKSSGKNIMAVLDKSPKECIHCPSVDLLFFSASELKGYGKIVVLMTGMGSDGSKGLIALKNNGFVKTIAESKETCVVFGMPKAAIATGYIDEIIALEEISETVMKYL